MAAPQIIAGAMVAGSMISAYGAGQSAEAQAGFEEDKLNEQKRQFVVNSRENKRQFNISTRENIRQFDVNKLTRDTEFAKTMSLEGRKLRQNKSQFDDSLEQRYDAMDQEYKIFDEGNLHQKDMFGLQVDENRRSELFQSRERKKDRDETQRQFDLSREDSNDQFAVATKDRRRSMRSNETQQRIANAGYDKMIAAAGR